MQPTQQTFRVRAEDALVRLEAEFAVADNAINVRYIVVNKTQTPVLVFDALRRLGQDGQLKYDPQMAYVTFEPPTTLALKRVIPDLPKEKDVEMSHMPWAHRAGPDEIVKGEIRLALPAEEYSPYYPAGKKAVFSDAKAMKLKLVVAYVPAGPGLPVMPVKDMPGLFEIGGPKETGEESAATKDVSKAVPQPEERLIQVEMTAPKPVPVRRRTDRFEPV